MDDYGDVWTEGSWANGRTQFSFRGRDGRVVFGQRVLRFPGSDPSQVRDASAGTPGQYVCFTGGQAVWLFQGVLLSNPASIRSEWVGREDQRTVWRKRTPSQYRTSPDTPAQKRAVSVSDSSAWFERCVGRYEILRQVVLSGRPYQRWG